MTNDRIPASTSSTQSPFLRGMRRDFGELLGRFRDLQHLAPGEFLEELTAPMFPAIDVSEDDKLFEITAEIPGVSEKDIDVSITRDTLVLKGQKSSQREESEQDFHILERRFGSFRRQIPLGFMPENGAVDAKFADGVLNVRVKKPENSTDPVHKIEISKG